MGGESSGSSIDSAADVATGTQSELVKIPDVQLYLVDGEESVRMGAGDLTLVLVVQAHTPLATLVAQVAELQWPIARDGPVLKIANFRYTFAIPGLLYGLILPDNTPHELVQRFESRLREFCAFEVRPEIARKAGASDLRLWPSVGRKVDGASEGARYWNAVAEDVEGYSVKAVQKMERGSKAAANSILKGGELASWGIKQGGSFVKKNTTPSGKSSGDVMSPRMQKRVEQARRMSAIAKLMSRTVLKGAISATGHVANVLGSAIGGVPPVQAFMSSDSRRDVAVASIDAFAKVVEAVETAGKSLAHATSSVGTDIVQHKFGEGAGQVAQDGMGAMGNVINSMWTLNKVGLYMLWRATAASTALNSSSYRSASRPASASSDASMPSANHMESMSPAFSPSTAAFSPSTAAFSPSTAAFSPNTASRQASIGPTISLAPPSQQDEVLQTAQLFPSAPLLCSPGQLYVPAPNLYLHPQAMMPPGYTYYPAAPHPNSPFQQYTRPSGSPQLQAFFPFGMEPPKTQ